MTNPINKTTKGKGRHYLTAKEGAGMTKAGRKAYNKATGSDLKAPVTTSKPSKSEAGRRASFCARMGGIVKTAKNSERARASMRRWKCR
jgi:hypothetical protein